MHIEIVIFSLLVSLLFLPVFVSGRMYSIRVEKRMVIQSIYICENGSMRHEPGSPALSRGMFLFDTTLVWYHFF